MSTVPITTWLRRYAGWSNSRQSWEERASAAALLVVAVGLCYWGELLSLLQNVVLWTLVAFAAALLFRRGWLKLFGPVLFYDMICLARRSRYFWLRMAYAGVLIGFLFMTWYGIRENMSPQQKYSLLAESFFGSFMYIQLLAVSILTPAYVASSIADEKERKTLEFMLATDLRNREIVLSKLFSRLANLTLFILTGLPILSILQFLGGVDPNLLLAGFLTTFMTMLGLGGFGILCSVWLKKPRDAVALAYLGPLTYVVIGLVGMAFQAGSFSLFTWPLGWWDGAPTVGEALDVYNSGNLVVCLIKVMTFIGNGTLQAALPGLLWHYSLFHLVVGLGSVAWAVIRVRALALQQAYGTTRKAGARHRARPEVGELPMLWKEIHIEGNIRFNWATRICVLLLILLTVGSGLWILLYSILEGHYFDSPDMFRMEINMWVRFAGTLVASLAILGVAVRASTAISSERDRDTFDALLTTPLDSDSILWSKFFGCLLGMRWALLWLGGIWFLGVVTGGVHIWSVPLVFAALVVFASSFILAGLWFSTVSRSGMRATLWTILTAVALSVGHWFPTMCCGFAMMMNGPDDGLETILKLQVGITPPAVLWMLPFEGQEFHDSSFREYLGIALLGVLLYALACIFFWVLFLAPRFRQLTMRDEFLYPRATLAQEMLRYQQVHKGEDVLVAPRAEEVPPQT